MWCAGRLGNCPECVGTRFHMTCLYCRWRRRHIGKFTDPKYWIKYTYLSWYRVSIVKKYVCDGKEYSRADGGYLRIQKNITLLIDPRGRFLRFRCAAIILIDKLMCRFGVSKKTRYTVLRDMRKPWAELCEFFANYP